MHLKETPVYSDRFPVPRRQGMGRTQRRSRGKKDGDAIDSSIDSRLRQLAVGQLDSKSRDQLFSELAKNPALVGRLAEHLRALSPM
jgi:hypothetical protein